MSAGPIKQWRDAFKVTPISSARSVAVCKVNDRGQSYCGRRPNHATVFWMSVTCADCLAARRADEGSRS